MDKDREEELESVEDIAQEIESQEVEEDPEIDEDVLIEEDSFEYGTRDIFLQNIEELEEEDDYLMSELDATLDEDQDFAIFQQLDNMISWRVKNFYDDDGKPKKRMDMRREPPIFEISDSAGNTADFILTKGLTESLHKVFEDVQYAYYGVDNTRKKNNKDKDIIDRTVSYVTEHPLQSIVLAGILLLFITSIIF